MKTKGKILSTLLMGTVIAAISTSVNAHDYTVSLGVSASSNQINQGDSVTVTVGASSINAGPGIDGFEANLQYSTDMYETVSASDISATTGWTLNYNPDTKKITSYTTDGSKITDSTTLFTINLKAKDPVGNASAYVTIANGMFSGGEEDGHSVDIGPKTDNAPITIIGASSETTPTPTPTSTPASTTETESVPTSLKVNTGDSTKSGKLPQTGENDAVIYGMAGILAVAALSLGGYIKYRKDIK